MYPHCTVCGLTQASQTLGPKTMKWAKQETRQGKYIFFIYPFILFHYANLSFVILNSMQMPFRAIKFSTTQSVTPRTLGGHFALDKRT